MKGITLSPLPILHSTPQIPILKHNEKMIDLEAWIFQNNLSPFQTMFYQRAGGGGRYILPEIVPHLHINLVPVRD